MISVRDVDELRAVVLAMRLVQRDVKNAINRETRRVLAPVWTATVQANATRPMDTKVLAAGVRVKAGNPPVLQAAQSTRPIGASKRLRPAEQWAAFEFGANREAVTTYQRRSPNGGTHKVTRHTKRQLPPRIRKGRVIYPAAAEVIPRAASLWVQTVVRMIHEAAEGRS